MLISTLVAADKDQVLFDFTKPDAAEAWVNVNDGVMGNHGSVAGAYSGV